ncbi:MAG: squalene--hopene cyclase [Rhodospirillaceae bacterium]
MDAIAVYRDSAPTGLPLADRSGDASHAEVRPTQEGLSPVARRHQGPTGPVPDIDFDALNNTISEAAGWLSSKRQEDGHWVFELEADATIPAEYVLLNHFLDQIDPDTENLIGVYLRRIQGDHGGWPLFHDGDFDMSASVKAYYALKIIGDDVDAPHMRRAREAILAHGGAERCNVFTRLTLAMFEQVPWHACPVTPVEAVLLPKWAPFHIDKVSYWSRTVMIPLMVLYSRRAKAINPRQIGIQELFRTKPEKVKNWMSNPTGHWLGSVFLKIDSVLQRVEPMLPDRLEEKAINRAVEFIEERLNGRDGLGGIFPAIANTMMMYQVLGHGKDHPNFVTAREAADGLLVRKINAEGEEEVYCQPCLSPVWDTALANHAMQEAGYDGKSDEITNANGWLRERQILDLEGDYAACRPGVRPGGWAFQYRNDHYPDVDDTAVVGMALDRAAEGEANQEAIARAAEWIIGMQSDNGGWGAFDADNEHYVLNYIPFADHGALLDPPTVDVSARCIGFLSQLGYADSETVRRGLDYIWKEQEADGSWFGRWGTNYVYGTWSALCAFNAVDWDMSDLRIQKAVDWIKERQLADGGWGEDCASYWDERKEEVKGSTPSQTAWALLGLMAAGEVDSPAVQRGVDYLMKAPREGGQWQEDLYNAVGFPRIFYLRYHGYPAYFPLWALARYRNLKAGNAKRPIYGL